MKNKNIVAQNVYHIFLTIYILGLANLNVANLYMSTSSDLEWSFPHGPFQMSCYVIVLAGTDLKCKLFQVFLSCPIKLHNSNVLLCYVFWNIDFFSTVWKLWCLGVVSTHYLSMVGHHDLLNCSLKHVIQENRINTCEQKIVTFSKELVSIYHCIMLKSYNLRNYLFHKLFTQSSLVLCSHWSGLCFVGSYFLLKQSYQLNLFFDQGKLKDYFRCLFWK